MHAIGRVKRSGTIDQQWPPQRLFANILLRDRPGLERDDRHLDVQRLKLIFVLAQLREMFLARQSGQVTVKDQKQPMTGAVVQSMEIARSIGELEVGGAAAC